VQIAEGVSNDIEDQILSKHILVIWSTAGLVLAKVKGLLDKNLLD